MFNFVRKWLDRKKPQKLIKKLTVNDFYWEHPDASKTREAYHKYIEHPHEKRYNPGYNKETGKISSWSMRPDWPTEYMWRFSIKDEKTCKIVTNWCLENCSEYWIWSKDTSPFFVEMGSASSVGWNNNQDYFIGIDNEAEAMAFKLEFDKNPFFNKTEAEKREETC